ncbi:molybdopterin synthase subunit MoaE [Anaerolinea thermolimosa]|nr:molybdopterin converting factor subunit 1 [Anaerolinea thermolimosa]GAP07037.1 molybdopterin synthase subunit MoaE [Anaerolinea thermolimosa]
MNDLIKVTVLFFASLKERVGMTSTTLEIPQGARVADLKAILLERFPALAGASGSIIISVNREFAFDSDPVADGAEVGLFPPVSGGEGGPTILRVTQAPLDLNEVVAQITLPTTGAACVFSGMVRGKTTRGAAHETIQLEYEAYIPMAEAKMAQVAREIRERWPAVEGIAIIQRIGSLEVGTPTVVIACSASHRDTGVFEAARYGIDRLKEIVPVWKKEIGPHGEIWVDGHYHPRRGD